jgi:hypothetical protein
MTLQDRIDEILRFNPPINPQATTQYNGETYTIENLPSADLRAMMGYGHINPFQRGVIERPDKIQWPYTPNMCLVASNSRGVWIGFHMKIDHDLH